MRTRLDHLVTSALQQGSAVPAFTCYDFTTALAVVAAAEESGRGVILLVAPKTAATPNGLRLIGALRGLADAAAVPVVVQLDHATDLPVMADAVAAGADSVLADGSSLAYEDNIALVRAARELLGPDVVLEAELGGLAGDEDRAFGADQSGVPVAGLTDSAQVEDFVSRTGAELLAVAVGNVHGKYQGEPELRWDVLQDIAVRTHIPLVLHGASGIPASAPASWPRCRSSCRPTGPTARTSRVSWATGTRPPAASPAPRWRPSPADLPFESRNAGLNPH
jgi:tagatose 1,6-diphosphate aldolase GatY/KbaY